MTQITYNLERIDNLSPDISSVSLSVDADGWGLHFGRWDQEGFKLFGFETSLDAWCFAAFHGFNPDAGIPDKFSQWTKRHPLPTPEPALQSSLFMEEKPNE
jgi:hypothetical protein